MQKTPNNFKNENKSYRTNTSQFQDLLQSYSNPKRHGTDIRIDIHINGKESRIQKPIHLWSIDFFYQGTKTIQWGKIVFLTNGAGTTGYPDVEE